MSDNTTMTRAQRVTVLRRFLTNYARLLAAGERARLEGSREEREEALVFYDAMMGIGMPLPRHHRLAFDLRFLNERL